MQYHAVQRAQHGDAGAPHAIAAAGAAGRCTSSVAPVLLPSRGPDDQ